MPNRLHPRRWHYMAIVAIAAMAAIAVTFARANDPAKPAPTPIDLDQYTLTFDENFDTLDVSDNGPGTRWIAHTPWAGDFGDALFANPKPGFPFTVNDGILRIEARKRPDGHWESGLLASVDTKNNGFKQQYGYFEMRAKLPAGAGLWPAFWLDSMVPKEFSDPSLEVDVIEHHGHLPDLFESFVSVWPKDNPKDRISVRNVHNFRTGMLYEDYHTFGASVEPDWIVIYLDRNEIWRTKTPPEHKHKLMILLNLAMGSGWPIDKAPNPSYMYVDYVRAYQRK